MLKQGLELKQQQKLSPLQIQTIRLIETPIVELAQAVRNELDNNPVLDDDHSSENKEDGDEQPKDVSIEEIKDDGDIPSYKLRVNNWGKDERPEYNTFSVKESFTQSLMDQLGFRQLSPHEYEVGKFIIGSLDEDGYLRRDLGSLVDDMAFRANIETDEEEVEKLLRIIQDFEPVGVGARDLRECLLLQLRNCEQTEEVRNAQIILRDYFPDFASKHFQKILSRMGIDKEELRADPALRQQRGGSPYWSAGAERHHPGRYHRTGAGGARPLPASASSIRPRAARWMTPTRSRPSRSYPISCWISGRTGA